MQGVVQPLAADGQRRQDGRWPQLKRVFGGHAREGNWTDQRSDTRGGHSLRWLLLVAMLALASLTAAVFPALASGLERAPIRFLAFGVCAAVLLFPFVLPHINAPAWLKGAIAVVLFVTFTGYLMREAYEWAGGKGFGLWGPITDRSLRNALFGFALYAVPSAYHLRGQRHEDA